MRARHCRIGQLTRLMKKKIYQGHTNLACMRIFQIFLMFVVVDKKIDVAFFNLSDIQLLFHQLILDRSKPYHSIYHLIMSLSLTKEEKKTVCNRKYSCKSQKIIITLAMIANDNFMYAGTMEQFFFFFYFSSE